MNKPLAGTRPAEILHVEDDDGVAELTREVFKMTNLSVKLHRAKDGEECMAFVRKQAPYTDAPIPDIILLDLNLPRMDGREVMEEISRDENLRHLPVVILSTSQDKKEILKMYQYRCSSYIVKPVDFAEFAHVLRSLGDYWLTVAVLPTAP